MSYVTVSNKGQVVIPADLRRQLGILPGSQVEVSLVEDKIEISVLHPAGHSTHESGFGMLKYAGPARRLADLDIAELMKQTKDAGK